MRVVSRWHKTATVMTTPQEPIPRSMCRSSVSSGSTDGKGGRDLADFGVAASGLGGVDAAESLPGCDEPSLALEGLLSTATQKAAPRGRWPEAPTAAAAEAFTASTPAAAGAGVDSSRTSNSRGVKRNRSAGELVQQEASLSNHIANGSTSKAARATSTAAASQVSTRRACFLGLDIEEFKVFNTWAWRVNGSQCCCLVGPNSSGKSSVLEALQFVLLRTRTSSCNGTGRSDRDLMRKGVSGSRPASVTAYFERLEPAVGSSDECSCAKQCDTSPKSAASKWAIRRQLRLTETGAYENVFWAGDPGHLECIPRDRYEAWIRTTLGWSEESEVWIQQFAFIEGRSATHMLGTLPSVLQHVQASDKTAAPLLKRRSGGRDGSGTAVAVGARRTAVEAWLARRIDEVYRELSREPLDEHMHEWGEGGQACLRRAEDGSFSLFVSERRGAAACGYGTPLEQLSDGNKDLCALALTLTLPGVLAGMQDKLPPFVVLDEPDSRLDKRHARALQKFLAGPSGPGQSLVLSLNNHDGFLGAVEVGGQDPC